MIKDIEKSYISKNFALECKMCDDTIKLVSISNELVSTNIKLISVLPNMIQAVWSWLEKNNIEMFVRVYESDYQNSSDLVKSINSIYKIGATGVQLFIKKKNFFLILPDFLKVKDNLFYNKKISICFDLDDFSINSWSDVFINLNKLKADVILLNYKKEKDDDFVGLVYGFLDNFDDRFKGEIHFSIGNSSIRVEQTWRLIEKMKPDLLDKVKFFILK